MKKKEKEKKMSKYEHTCDNPLETMDDYWMFMLCIACHDEYEKQKIYK